MGYYDWVNERRNGKSATVVSCDTSEEEVPIEKCRAKGGPTQCSVHSEMLKNKLENEDVESPYVTQDQVKGILQGIYNRVALSNGIVSDEDMAMLNGLVDRMSNGELKPLRVPCDLFDDRKVTGIPKWVKGMYQVMAAMADSTPAVDHRSLRIQNAREQALIKAFAQKNDGWTDELEDFAAQMSGRESFGHGAESNVYDCGDFVLKTNDPYTLSRSPIEAVERYMMFNYFFPESRIEMLGFGNIGDEDYPMLGFALAQPKFDFDKMVVGKEDVLSFMHGKGFESIDDGQGYDFKTIGGNGCIHAGDVNEGNILRTKDGQIRVIDAVMRLNVREYGCGGNYSYANPPDRMPTNGND